MRILNDIGDFFNTLSFVDVVFFLAVLALMVLIITLIYFIKINNDIKNEENNEVKEETAEMKIVKEIREATSNMVEPTINFNDYEKDQEDKAIISYEELLNKSNNYGLNYEKEEMHDDLLVKKVNMEDFSLKGGEAKPIGDARVISFAKEEAFLEALKRLQKELG